MEPGRSGAARVTVALRRFVAWVLGAAFWRPGRARLKSQLSDAVRVVLVRTDDRVGEALLMTPLVAALAERFEVELVLHPKCLRVLEGLPGVKALHSFERRWLWRGLLSPQIRRLRNLTRGAVVVNCASWKEHSGTVAVVSRLIAPHSCVVGPAVQAPLRLADVCVPPLAGTESERLQRLHLLSPLIGEVAPRPLAFRTPRPSNALKSWVREQVPPLVVVNPGGRLGERRVSPAVFSALCRQVSTSGRTAVVTWGPGEEPLAESVASAAPGTLVGPATDLDELAFVFRHAEAVVCNNTGPMHLAVAVNTPTLALFLNMSAARWGHPTAPHQMVDLTPCRSQAEMERAALRALDSMLPSRLVPSHSEDDRFRSP